MSEWEADATAEAGRLPWDAPRVGDWNGPTLQRYGFPAEPLPGTSGVVGVWPDDEPPPF